MARYDQNNKPYSWMPGFLRSFLNLDYDDPQGERGSSYDQAEPRSYTQASQPAANTWSPPNEPTFKATSMEGYTPPAGSGYTPPPAAAPRPNAGAAPANMAAPMQQTEGYIQPITYLLRGYARGVLPPQGLEAFTKETRATTTDVWNLYSHWIRFQTEEIFRFGRELLDAVADGAPASNTPATTARRIKVTVANGNGNGNHGAAAPEPAAPAAAAPAPEAPVMPLPAEASAEDADQDAADESKS